MSNFWDTIAQIRTIAANSVNNATKLICPLRIYTLRYLPSASRALFPVVKKPGLHPALNAFDLEVLRNQTRSR
jgi:hypothetical protein